MLYPRIIPCLLIQNKGLVKTVKFKEPKYVGDPINAVKIFNEKEVDELIVVDIDATREGREPNYGLIENLASECRMPLCYGGGIKTVKQAQRIFSLGVEKVAVSSIAVKNPDIITEMASKVGSQSVAVVLDIKKKLLGSHYELFTHNGNKSTGIDPVKFVVQMEKAGAGELVINSIDRDGMMNGYDQTIIDKIRELTDLPMTVMGGVGSLDDIGNMVRKHGIIGAAAGSYFVFKGKYRAVLINYPSPLEKEALINEYFLPQWGTHNMGL
jgi:cyclase